MAGQGPHKAKIEEFLLAICITAFVATFNAVNMLLVRSSASYGESMADDDADTRTTIDLQARRLGGAVVQRPVEDKKAKKKRMFHTAVTANDNPYSKWQCRIMYHWYKKYAAMEGSEMGGYTRILHTGQPDNLMEEIPTWVAQPLPAGMDQVRSCSEFTLCGHVSIACVLAHSPLSLALRATWC